MSLVAFRVNVDKSNKKYYNETHAFLKAKFPQDNVLIYPGILDSYSEEKHNPNCFSNQEEIAFYLEQNRIHNIKAINFFPKQKISSCIADTRNGYVVGPEGELYKCLANLGNIEEIVGYIDQEKPWNMALLGAWLEGQNALNDSRCAKCSILPICDGGCSYIRLKQYLEGKSIHNCSYLKKHLSDLLKEYYDIKTQA